MKNIAAQYVTIGAHIEGYGTVTQVHLPYEDEYGTVISFVIRLDTGGLLPIAFRASEQLNVS